MVSEKKIYLPQQSMCFIYTKDNSFKKKTVLNVYSALREKKEQRSSEINKKDNASNLHENK